jgi:hypothetical protein
MTTPPYIHSDVPHVVRIEVGTEGVRMCLALPDGSRVTQWEKLEGDEREVILNVCRRRGIIGKWEPRDVLQ